MRTTWLYSGLLIYGRHVLTFCLRPCCFLPTTSHGEPQPQQRCVLLNARAAAMRREPHQARRAAVRGFGSFGAYKARTQNIWIRRLALRSHNWSSKSSTSDHEGSQSDMPAVGVLQVAFGFQVRNLRRFGKIHPGSLSLCRDP